MKLLKIPLVLLVIFFLSSCSNPGKEYEAIQQLQTSTEQSIQSTSDDTAKVSVCDNVIKSLNEFIKNHPEGEWNLTAKTDLRTWQSKKAEIQENIKRKLEIEQEITNRKLDFEELQKLQDAAEQVMQHSTDYAVRMKNCDDIINSLQNYISKHPEGDYTTSVKTAILSWESRKTGLDQELKSLYNSLYAKMKDRAITEAKKVHNWSNIEEVILRNRDKKSIGANIQVTDIYAIRMRGKILKTSIFKLDITVTGGIEPATKRVFVDDDVKVLE